jgi:DNA-binding MarR family transcriptional regulator
VPLFEEDGLRIGELGRRARLSKQAMTTLIRLMERNGLVERRPDALDQRAARIYLTERSQQFRPVAAAILDELHFLVQQRVQASDVDVLARVLEQLIDF